MSELPDGWVQARLMDIVDLHDSRRVPLNNAERQKRQGQYPYYGANGLVDHIDDFIFDGAYVLLAEDGGYFDDPTRGVAYEASGKFWVNNHAHILSPKDEIPNRFVTHLLNAVPWMNYVGGSTRLKLTQAGMQQVQIALPPLAEQGRITSKVDVIRNRSSRARRELDNIPKLIERYKQAILAKAFSGELTADWRRENRYDASNFMRTVGITPVDSESEHLPAGWYWVHAAELCLIKSGVALGKKRSPETELIELPYLRVANVQRGWLDLAQIKTTSVSKREAQALALLPGDVLMNEGGDRDKLGRGWVWEGQLENCIHQNHVFRLRPKSDKIPSRYISYYANEFGQQYFIDEGKQTTNLASISMSKLSALPIPLCTPDEMSLVVHRIETAFSWLDKIAKEHARAEYLLPKLDQAILAKAFRGELVPQNPNDEPASVLLERIAATRSKEAGAPRRGRRSKG